MTPSQPRAVLDTVVYVQALISGRGPAAACIEAAKGGQYFLFISDPLMAELRDVPLRPDLTRRYPFLTPERVEAFLTEIAGLAVNIHAPPNIFNLPRDPKDEPLIDVAVAADAAYIVTWNQRHLTYLMRKDTPEGIEFCQRFHNLKIVDPPTFLQLLRTSRAPEAI